MGDNPLARLINFSNATLAAVHREIEAAQQPPYDPKAEPTTAVADKVAGLLKGFGARMALADKALAFIDKGAESRPGIVKSLSETLRTKAWGSYMSGVLGAQNDTYLELCNAGWRGQWIAGMGMPAVVLACLFLVFGWYGFAVHPLVYLLRPSYCGGNKVFEWGRLVALMDSTPSDGRKVNESTLALYHPPFDANDPEAKGEDCIFVGPELPGSMRIEATACFWEYIRLYMEEGPTVERIPPNAPENYKQIPHLLPEPYNTYCGKPSPAQYDLEEKPGLLQTMYHMISQVTCSWPRFPKEWESDSGVGEPEDRPVQAGAVMTALVYRAQGKLSKADKVELMRRYGTEEGQAEAAARSED